MYQVAVILNIPSCVVTDDAVTMQLRTSSSSMSRTTPYFAYREMNIMIMVSHKKFNRLLKLGVSRHNDYIIDLLILRRRFHCLKRCCRVVRASSA